MTEGDGCHRPPEAFEEFFHREYPRLAKAMLLVTGDRADAEDLVQEAMARALERWARVRAMESPAGYVYRIAVNLHRRRLRRGFRERPAREGTAAVERDPAEIAEARDGVLRALQCLSTDQRVALVLVEWLVYLPRKPAGCSARLYRSGLGCIGRERP
ncbi:MAG: hypothetical protein KatS3mg014_1985 [Actinomycetota bacterium]|nr:MAG: hypothetical protein KatS3mg014_1985 [Actinomycetota bacterium]